LPICQALLNSDLAHLCFIDAEKSGSTASLGAARATLDEFLHLAESDMAIPPGRRMMDWETYWHGALKYQDQKDFESPL
jgi:hypothetical protein